MAEVAQRTGLTRAAARRFLLTLVDLEYVSFDGRTFALRPTVLELGYPYISTLSVPTVAAPHLNELVDRVSASAFLSVLDNGNVFYVAQLPAKRMLAVTLPVGTRVAAYATSMGQVLLAALPAYRAPRVPRADGFRAVDTEDARGPSRGRRSVGKRLSRRLRHR